MFMPNVGPAAIRFFSKAVLVRIAITCTCVIGAGRFRGDRFPAGGRGRRRLEHAGVTDQRLVTCLGQVDVDAENTIFLVGADQGLAGGSRMSLVPINCMTPSLLFGLGATISSAARTVLKKYPAAGVPARARRPTGSRCRLPSSAKVRITSGKRIS